MTIRIGVRISSENYNTAGETAWATTRIDNLQAIAIRNEA